MEPEVKTMLTQKIRTLEREPVSWNREEVWLKVHDRVSSTRKRYWKYYVAAAAVIFFLCFNVYTLQQNQPIPAGDVHGDEIQAGTYVEHNQGTVQPETKQESKTGSPPTQGDGRREENQVATATDDKLNRLQTRPQEGINPEAASIEVELNIEEPNVASREAADEERIMPIVGIVGLSVQNNVATKSKRKKLFHKLEPSQTEFDDSFKNTIIIARTK